MVVVILLDYVVYKANLELCLWMNGAYRGFYLICLKMSVY